MERSLRGVGYLLATVFFVSQHAVAAERKGEPLYVSYCSAAKGQLKAEELQALLSESSLADLQVRRGLITLMQKQDNRCRKSLENWLVEMRSQTLEHRTKTGRLAAITLGVLLDMPAAKQLVEAEAASGAGLEWLATLQQWDERAYNDLLRKWVIRSGEQIRRSRGLGQLSAEVYGRNQIQELTQSAAVQPLPPIVFDLFLKSLGLRNADADEISALNAIFVNLNAGARNLYADAYIPVLRRNAVSWVAAFRSESAWTQFQLLELMGRTGGAEMVRELMWLSQNHTDSRMKSRASQVLDESLKMR